MCPQVEMNKESNERRRTSIALFCRNKSLDYEAHSVVENIYLVSLKSLKVQNSKEEENAKAVVWKKHQ